MFICLLLIEDDLSKMNDSVLPAAGAYSRTKVLTEMIEALLKGYSFS